MASSSLPFAFLSASPPLPPPSLVPLLSPTSATTTTTTTITPPPPSRPATTTRITKWHINTDRRRRRRPTTTATATITASAKPISTKTKTTNKTIKSRNAASTIPRLQPRHRSCAASYVIAPESYEDHIPSPPDGGWGWVVVVASLFCNMIVDGLGYSFGVFLQELADYFHESKSKVSLVGSVLVGGYNVAGPVVSALTNKLGCRPVAMAGSVLAAVSFALSTLAPSVGILILTYGVMGGFGLGMVYLPSIVSVGYYFEKKRALATGIAVCGSGIGTFIFAPLSEFLLQKMDWRNALLLLSGITLNCAVCGMMMKPLKPSSRPLATGGQRPGMPSTRISKNRSLLPEYRATKFSMGDIKTLTTVKDVQAKLHQMEGSKLTDPVSSNASEPLPLSQIQLPPLQPPPKQQSQKNNEKTSSAISQDHFTSPTLYNVSSETELLSEKRPKNDRQPSYYSGSSHVSIHFIPRDLPELIQYPACSQSVKRGTKASVHSLLTDKHGASNCTVAGNHVGKMLDSCKEPGCGEGLSGTTVTTMSSVTTSHASYATLDETQGKCDDDDEDEVGDDDSHHYVNDEGSEATTTGSVTPDYDCKTETSLNYYTLVRSTSDTSPGTHGKHREHSLACRSQATGHRKSDTEIARFEHRLSKCSCKTSGPSNLKYYMQLPDTAPVLVESQTRKLPGPNQQESAVANAQRSQEKNVRRLHGVVSPVGACGLSVLSLNVNKKDLARPLYRRDVFYSGSVEQLPEFQAQPNMKSYITSITTIPGYRALVTGDEAKVWRCLQCCPQSFKGTLQEMLDMSLLRDPGFMLICMGNVLAFLGFYVPFVYCVDLAVNQGIAKSKAAFLISVIGITNTVGRVVTGWLADLRKINSLVITYVSIFICGLSTTLFPFCNSYGLLCACASVFGLSVAAFVSISSILICDRLGLDKLTSGFGLLSLFRGMAAMAGPPLAGILFDHTRSYWASFYMGGVLMSSGALCHLSLKLPCVPRKESEAFQQEVLTAAEEVPLPLIKEISERVVKPDMVPLEDAF